MFLQRGTGSSSKTGFTLSHRGIVSRRQKEVALTAVVNDFGQHWSDETNFSWRYTNPCRSITSRQAASLRSKLHDAFAGLVLGSW